MSGDEETATMVDAAPAWTPTAEVVARSNIAASLRELNLGSYAELHRFSVTRREEFWDHVIRRLGIKFRRPYECVLDPNSPPARPTWLPGARLNIVESCFQAGDDRPAIVYGGRNALRTITYGDLRSTVQRVAAALARRGIGPGTTVGVIAPLTPSSVAAYLGIIHAGAAAVSIADSFAPTEIATRLKIGGARLVFAHGTIQRVGKLHDIYDKLRQANAPPAVILTDASDHGPSNLRDGDVTWDDFLADAREPALEAVERDPHDAINILFSSGTTGEPKAIVWEQTTPIKCASDAHFHQDVHAGDVTCWPTSMGWMMGPWLIFGTLINRGTIALYDDAPAGKPFGRFVQDARINMLGLVPSFVRDWRQTRCMEGLDWTAIRAFSSTGECSNADDMRYLMQLPGDGGRPMVEYCGGTELAGGYVAGTVVQPCIPAAFSTPTLGLNFVLRDEDGEFGDRGEVLLVGPSIGLSRRMLNRDNDAVYYASAPAGPEGQVLRKHGDELERFNGGYYRVLGRCDDTMNLGGIKVGCAEIERVVCGLSDVVEAAAVAVPPRGGGPSRLVVFAVTRAGSSRSTDALRDEMQLRVREQLNPLFKISQVRTLPSLPRTASNKILRRELRAAYESNP